MGIQWLNILSGPIENGLDRDFLKDGQVIFLCGPTCGKMRDDRIVKGIWHAGDCWHSSPAGFAEPKIKNIIFEKIVPQAADQGRGAGVGARAGANWEKA